MQETVTASDTVDNNGQLICELEPDFEETLIRLKSKSTLVRKMKQAVFHDSSQICSGAS